jgi:hypothetical protein
MRLGGNFLKIIRLSFSLFLLIGLVGCIETRQHSNPFDSVRFPQQYCGDSLPQDKNAYPVEFYSVLIPGNEENRKLIEDKYCQHILTGLGKKSRTVQVASFIGRDRAQDFKEILNRDFKDVEISQPTIIDTESLQNSSAFNNSYKVDRKLNNPKKIGSAALLNESQINTLLKIDGTQAISRNRKYPIRVVLPTYIPKGYELVQFEVKRIESMYGGNEYYLWYKNTNNSCFNFRGGFIQILGGPPILAMTVDSNSPALGRVSITAVRSEKSSSQLNYIGFYSDFVQRDFGLFEFSSPGSGYDKESCKTMNFVEAVKVAESFQFLQPDVKN